MYINRYILKKIKKQNYTYTHTDILLLMFTLEISYLHTFWQE